MSYDFYRKFTIIHSEFCQLMMILYHICNIETRWKIFCKTKNCYKTIFNMFYVLITSYFYIIHHIFSNYLFHHFQYVTFARTAEADELYEAIPVWERAYAVTKTKRCVKGAAGTRGADKVIAEDALLRTYGLHSYRPL